MASWAYPRVSSDRGLPPDRAGGQVVRGERGPAVQVERVRAERGAVRVRDRHAPQRPDAGRRRAGRPAAPIRQSSSEKASAISRISRRSNSADGSASGAEEISPSSIVLISWGARLAAAAARAALSVRPLVPTSDQPAARLIGVPGTRTCQFSALVAARDPPGHLGRLGGAGARQHHHELVAGEPGHEVAAAHHPVEHAGDALQHQVAAVPAVPQR